MDRNEASRDLHARSRGKIATAMKVVVETKEDLALVYTPGVAYVSELIAVDSATANTYTNIGNTVAIITDGSAVLGLGNIGPKAAMPVMEGKALLFKKFADIDAVPIILNTQNVDEIVAAITAISPSFGGINLEDIAAPHCFDIEKKLQATLPIPVFHDDQHGTATVVLAGIINALRLRGLAKDDARIVINGAGAAGLAIFDLLWEAGYKNMVVVDSVGVLTSRRLDLTSYKKEVADKTNSASNTLDEALMGTHVFIGVSKGNVLTKEMVRTMAECPIIFAMANPTPEILPMDAIEAGAFVVATGRSDYPNQVNNALAFPGLFRGALDTRTVHITNAHMIAAASAIAGLVETPTIECIIPDIFDPRLVGVVAGVFQKA